MKTLYVIDNNEKTNYKYNIEEDTIIYHFSINSSSDVSIDMSKEDVTLYYYYNNINYDDNYFNIKVNHLVDNTHSEVFNHGVNVKTNKLKYNVDGVVIKSANKCICNQDNQIINMTDGKSTICPNLLIDNYDVDSNHAAYIGKFKDEVLFYMMSRGIREDEAIKLMIKGIIFADLVIDDEERERILKVIDDTYHF